MATRPRRLRRGLTGSGVRCSPRSPPITASKTREERRCISACVDVRHTARKRATCCEVRGQGRDATAKPANDDASAGTTSAGAPSWWEGAGGQPRWARCHRHLHHEKESPVLTKEEHAALLHSLAVDRLLQLVTLEAKRLHDGHVTIVALTTHYQVAFGPPI